jgi:beta-lactamase regulating signal transducer with metallopeptidase domain/protein involved in polysaccharide export with SLBB domain
VWQGAAAGVVLALLLRVCHASRATVRYGLCAATMLVMAAALPVTFWALGGRPDAAPPPAVRPAVAHASAAAVPAPTTITGDGSSPPVEPSALSSSWRQRTLRAVPAVWLAGIGVLAVWRLGGWVRLRRLMRATSDLAEPWQHAARDLAGRMRVSTPVRLVEAAWVSVPSVIGVLRPVILLPVSALTALPPAQVQALLAHELAHVRRHDYLVNLVQVAVETLLFYHPVVWWVSARLREERENCCDEAVVDLCGDRVEYARALLAMETARQGMPTMAGGTLVLAASGGPLLRRVQRLLGVAPAAPNSRALAPALAAVVLALPLLAGYLYAVAEPGKANGAPATRPATQPTTDVTPASPELTEVTPEDLKVALEDYRIAPNDLIQVTIFGLEGNGLQTIKTTRVSGTGNIALPFLKDPVRIAEKTEADAQEVVADAYRKAGRLKDPQVGLTVAEARSNFYYVQGHVRRAGAYALPAGQEVLLLQAIAAAGGPEDGAGNEMMILRKRPKERAIRVPLDKLMGGDPRFNIPVISGDTIMVRGGPNKEVPVTVTPDGLKLDGKAVTWDGLPAAMKKIPDSERPGTVLVVSPATQDMTFRQFNDALKRLRAAAEPLGLRELKVRTPAE